MSVYLREIQIKKETEKNHQQNYPFNIPSIQSLDKLAIDSPVTFFAGENGSGKSTLMEVIAFQCGFNPAGGSRDHSYDLDQATSVLGESIRLSWSFKVTNGFFMRAESFYHFASHLDAVNSTYDKYGGKSLHIQSHGESFISLFNNFREKGIYLLDEPEAALSPQRQLSLCGSCSS